MPNLFSKKFIFNKIFLAIFILAVSFSILFKAEAATLSFSPSSSDVSAGNIVSVKVIVNTVNKSINNAEGIIQFPTELLEVVSINKSSSVFSLWVEEPSFSNYTGKITFNGGVPNPGFNGASGNVISITFKAKKQGTASIIFGDSAVRENDGLGTDILSSKSSGNIQIGASKEVVTPVVSNNKNIVPIKPVIFSDTHPNQELWYASNTASFNWKIPAGVTSLETLIGRIPDSIPNIYYDNSVTQKTISNLSDGVLYFHLRYFNSAGGGPIAHYKIKIDTTSPLKFIPQIRVENNQNVVKLNAEDETSGIDYYTIQIDDNPAIKVKKSELINEEYYLPYQTEGSHDLFITAYDKALNHTESNLTFISPPIILPILSLKPEEITKGESVVILGKTIYPNKPVEVILELDGKEIKKYTQTISADGSFSITTDEIKNSGLVSISARVMLSDIIKSPLSEKVYLRVNETKVVKISLAVLYPLIGILAVVSLVVILLFILYLGWHKFYGLKKKINKELQNTALEVHKAMLLLKEELSNQLEALEKIKMDRVLNKKEEAIFNEIQKNIDDIDKFIEKKLKKVM